MSLLVKEFSRLGNLPPTAGDRYQIMRHDHQLGIDAFVSDNIGHYLDLNLFWDHNLNLDPDSSLDYLMGGEKV